MSDFSPGVESMKQAGIPVSVRPYVGTGREQVRMSLETMAAKMREGRIDAGVRGWALQSLRNHGLDGRDGNTTPFRQAAALLDDFRTATVYAPDPYGVELVPGAGATLCLRPGLCLNGDDCDGLSVGYGSLALSIGLPVQIVKQNFGGGQQEHVLIAVHDGNDWQYADPSTNLPFGSALRANSEVWIDPMEPIGALPEVQPSIVTLGQTPAPSTWSLVASGSATLPGRRYRLGILVDPNFYNDVRGLFGRAGWNVESAVNTGEVTGALQSWVVQAISTSVVMLTDSQWLKYVAVAIETPAPNAVQPPPASNDVGFTTVAIGATVLAVSGGILLALVARKNKRRRR